MKKEPLRKCLATNERLAKKDLIRVVKNNENKVFVDLSGKANGRGAYIKKSLEAVEIAKKRINEEEPNQTNIFDFMED